jgi:hypothetical protein
MLPRNSDAGVVCPGVPVSVTPGPTFLPPLRAIPALSTVEYRRVKHRARRNKRAGQTIVATTGERSQRPAAARAGRTGGKRLTRRWQQLTWISNALRRCLRIACHSAQRRVPMVQIVEQPLPGDAAMADPGASPVAPVKRRTRSATDGRKKSSAPPAAPAAGSALAATAPAAPTAAAPTAAPIAALGRPPPARLRRAGKHRPHDQHRARPVERRHLAGIAGDGLS